MKRILITGLNSYIGNSFEEWLLQWPGEYNVDKISLKDDHWRELDWTSYDSILHVAGIAHNSSDKALENLYYSVNRDLTEAVAKKGKIDGVRQFVFLSSIIVFGTSNGSIDETTKLNPDNFYGDSKLQAEQKLMELSDENFKVAIIRPPMIYGTDSKGNFPSLVKLSRIIPFFPKYKNKRSMLYIKNLTEFLRIIIDRNEKGFFHVQNSKYVRTDHLVRILGEKQGHKILMINGFSKIISKLKDRGLFKKVFGDLYYAQELTEFPDFSYQIFDFESSIKDLEVGDRVNES